MCIGMSSREVKFQTSNLLRKLCASRKVPFLLIWGEKDKFIPLFVGKKIANFHRWVKLSPGMILSILLLITFAEGG